MASTPVEPPDGKPYASDTKRTAPRRLLVFIVPLAVVALIVLVVAMKYIGHTG